jgi:hypothetical protein
MDGLIFLVQRLADQLFPHTSRMVQAALTGCYEAFDNVRLSEGRPFTALALGYDALWMPGIDPTEFDFLGFVVPRDAIHNAHRSTSLSLSAPASWQRTI